jgi:DNA polymerase/3'-5' exonuclease PolX
MRLNVATHIAINISERLWPYASKLNIAGSIRREKPEVKDIEIVCLPRYIEGGQVQMFSTDTPSLVLSPGFCMEVKMLGKVIKGKPDGRYMQIELPQGINLDLFMPEADDYYRQFAIRTGSADYAQRTIARGWNRIGWCGSDVGLRKIEDCDEICEGSSGKRVGWKCNNPHAERPPVWQSEKDFFDWIQVPYIMPKLRTI